ncbi:MAG TPA: hypothetical protein VII38_17540 [Polyangia bacterium]
MAAKQKVQAAQAALSELAPKVQNPMVMRAEALRIHQENEAAKETAKKKEDAAQRITATADLKNVGHGVVEIVKTAAIHALIAALKKMKEVVFEKAKAWAGDKHKGPKEKKSLLVEVATAALSGGVTESALMFLQTEIKKGIEAIIDHMLKEEIGVGGVAKLADGPIQTLLDSIKEKLKAEKRIDGLFEPLVERLLGGEEKEGKGGEEKGGGEGGEKKPEVAKAD